MLLSDEQKSLLWLSTAEISAERVQELTRTYHSPLGIWESFGTANGPSFQANAQSVLKRLHSRDAMDDLLARHHQLNVHMLFQDDKSYPELLRAIDNPPYLLYYAGRLECLSKTCMAIVGTRMASAYGQEMASAIAQGLCESDVCVVSGLARGIDAAAHKGALSVNGRTIGVLGSGINHPYPAEHTPMLRKIAGGIGLVVSEYPLDSEPAGFHFPYRNRIISGLCQGIVFVEGKVKSGGMITVTTALAQGREVFAVPGRVGTALSEGPHIILREGARLVTCAQDILDDLGISESAGLRKERVATNLSPMQRDIVEALQMEPMNPDELSVKLEQSVETVLTELSMMEIAGLVVREAGNQFTLPIAKH